MFYQNSAARILLIDALSTGQEFISEPMQQVKVDS